MQMKWLTRLLAVAVLCAVAAGCASDKEEKIIKVSDSQLNWLEIVYLPDGKQPPVHISMTGAGDIRIKRGKSPLIGNDFSVDVGNKDWGDTQEDQINTTSADMREIFQTFVNRGLLLKTPNPVFLAESKRGGASARIRGTLDSEQILRIAVEPELLAVIRYLVTYSDETSRNDSRKSSDGVMTTHP
jgi:hypothetical protein